ncbi:MAG: PAS domain-containing protein [Vulcanimicrobiota bacterium]
MQYLSPGICRFLHRSLSDLLGTGYDRQVHQQDRQPLLRRLAEAVARKDSYQLSYRVNGLEVAEYGRCHADSLLGDLHFPDRSVPRAARSNNVEHDSGASLACLDRSYRYLSANSAWCRTHGLEVHEVSAVVGHGPGNPGADLRK